MIVVLSDLHFQDTATNGPCQQSGANVSSAAFEQLWRQLDVFAERVGATEPLTIVLNGDIIELLRSEQWLNDGSRPYNFVGVPDGDALRTASQIGASVLRENERGIAALRGRRDDVRFRSLDAIRNARGRTRALRGAPGGGRSVRRFVPR